MKILFIGGNGNISWHCTNEAIKKGHKVYILNREATLNSRRKIPDTVIKLTGDIRNFCEMQKLLKNLEFDVVCDFICFNEEHAKTAIELFRNKTNQYIFISSESVYKREARYLPFKETCPKVEASCGYIAGKMKAEETFLSAYEEFDFPVTIVRPGYTYDTIVPASMGHNCFTAISRFLNGKPVLIAGEGHNLWAFTHSKDFATAFVELIGNENAIGEDFHITTDEWLTWNDATAILLAELGVKSPQIIHIPFEDVLQTKLAIFNQKDLMYQKMWHNIYDNSKIKKFVPNWKAKIDFSQGIRQTISWLYENDAHRRINVELDKILEDITEEYIEIGK